LRDKIKKGAAMQAIVAVDSNWAIGNKGQLLVSIPADQKNFRNITMGKTIVYGRKTLETFPQQVVLPGRRNIILSTRPDYEVRNAEVVHNRQELLEAVKDLDPDDVFIIGGASVYREFLDDCDTCIVTFIDREYEADSFFPNLDKLPEWELTDESDEQVYFDITYTYRTYKRK
jgi:dihydrofolate reductase